MIRRAFLVRFVLLALFFVSTLALSVLRPGVFVSPDEHANFLFAQAFAERQTLCLSEPLNVELGGIVHPRSIVSVGACLVPGSFLGLPLLAGAVGLVLGEWAIVLFTPAVATLALCALWSIVRSVFRSERVADLAVLFTALHPAYWYYTARAMMHNVPFVALLVFAVWFALRRTGWSMVWAGACVGLALFFRTAEVVWVMGVLVALGVMVRRYISWVHIGKFLVGLICVGGVIAVCNAWVYGAPWMSGYFVRETPIGEVLEGSAAVQDPLVGEVSDVQSAVSWTRVVGDAFFPFGIHEYATLRNVWRYGVQLYPLFTALAVIGGAYALTRKELRVFALGSLCIAAWLGVMYGSWTFSDNPDPRVVTIGNSHVRYWLPVFMLGAIFSALVVDRAYDWVRGRWGVAWARGGVGLLIALVVGMGAPIVLWRGDGVLPNLEALESFERKRDAVVAATDPQGIIVVDRADKFLFPERRVVVPLRDDRTYQALPVLRDAAPLYYFGLTLPDIDVQYLREQKLAPLGLTIVEVITVENETLYRFEWL